MWFLWLMILVLTAPGKDFLSLRPCCTSSVPVRLVSDKRQCETQFLDLKEHKKCLRCTLHKLRCQHLKLRIHSVEWGGYWGLTIWRLTATIWVVPHSWPPDASFYIFIQQIYVLNTLNMLHNLRFFSSKCSLFHNATFFGSCIIHILNTGCAKI